MQLRALGKSPVEVTPVGLGAWQFSDGRGVAGKCWPTLEHIPLDQIIQAMLDGGANWFDTAEMYGWGASEKALTKSLRAIGKRPGDVVIATKWYPVLRSADSLLRTIEDRKRALDGFPIDLHQIHMPLSRSTIKTEMKMMARLLNDGHIRAAGVSNYTASMMRRAHAALAAQGHPLASNQMEYSILNRRIESNGVMDAAKELGMTIIAYSPLAQGLVSGRYHDDPSMLKSRSGLRRFLPPWGAGSLRKSRPVIDALREIGQKYEATSSQVALNWLTHFHGETVVAIPGATKLSQAQQNVGALGFTLSQDELNHLDEVSRPFK
jgi:aryl-alcohol dehydrogenase-like predicted oxidoreductase